MALFGTSGKWEQKSTQTPQQQQISNQFLQQLPGLFQQLSQPVDRSKSLAESIKAYRTQGVPAIMDAAGGGPTAQGQRGSSLFSALAGGEKQLQESLAAQQEGYRENDMNRLQGLFGSLSNIGFQPQFENVYRQPTQGFVPHVLGNLAAGAGSYLGSGSNPLSGIMGLFGGRQMQQPTIGQPQQQQQQMQNINPATIQQLLGLLSLLQSRGMFPQQAQ